MKQESMNHAVFRYSGELQKEVGRMMREITSKGIPVDVAEDMIRGALAITIAGMTVGRRVKPERAVGLAAKMASDVEQVAVEFITKHNQRMAGMQ